MAGMFFSSAPFASAESSSSSVAELTAQVQALLAQVAALQTQISSARTEIAAVKKELALTRSLAFGSKGKDVTELQEFLQAFPDIYPEGLVTGFFGHATENAVKRLQKKHGIDAVGVVGPKTRQQLKLLSGVKGQGKCIGGICDLGVSGSTSPKTTGAGTEKVTICHNSGETITIAAPALPAHVAHGDTLGVCSGGGGTGTTTPDTIAPTISSVSAGMITASTAKITWNTNEIADSTVWYGGVNPLDIASTTLTTMVNNVTLTTLHETALSGLMASTTYYYIVGSKDAVGNQATSSQASFQTL